MSEKPSEKGSAPPLEMYFPPNKLAAAIGEGSGPSLRDMEENAAKRLERSKKDYDIVLRDTIDRMKGLNKSDVGKIELHNSLFIEAHDIKGQASLFGFPLVSEIAACICLAIRDVPKKLEDQPELLDLHINALEWAFINQNSDELNVEKSMLVKSLHEALASD